MEWSSKASSMVQMNGESVIAKDSVILNDLWSLISFAAVRVLLERLVMMSIHVANQKVENWHVHQVQ